MTEISEVVLDTMAMLDTPENKQNDVLREIGKNTDLNYTTVLKISRGQKCSDQAEYRLRKYHRRLKRKPHRSGQVIYCGHMTAAQRQAVIEKLSPDQRTQVLLEAVESRE